MVAAHAVPHLHIVPSAEFEQDEVVHVRLSEDRLWHRRLAGALSTETACGRSADVRLGEVSATRHENYRGPLCPYCFTAREFSISNEITQED